MPANFYPIPGCAFPYWATSFKKRFGLGKAFAVKLEICLFSLFRCIGFIANCAWVLDKRSTKTTSKSKHIQRVWFPCDMVGYWINAWPKTRAKVNMLERFYSPCHLPACSPYSNRMRPSTHVYRTTAIVHRLKPWKALSIRLEYKTTLHQRCSPPWWLNRLWLLTKVLPIK